MHTPTRPVNFAYPTASNALISSCRDCTNLGWLSARPQAARMPLMPSPGKAKTLSTPQSRSRSSR